jgi:hypothetical protein
MVGVLPYFVLLFSAIWIDLPVHAICNVDFYRNLSILPIMTRLFTPSSPHCLFIRFAAFDIELHVIFLWCL